MNEVNGFVADGFGPVADAYRKSVGDGEGGSALNIRVGGETVVDLWAGLADRHEGRPWARDTPTVIFSCTKGLIAVLVAMLVGQGRLGLDRPVADYWPEFAAAGKEAVTVRQLLSHRAGLAAPREDISLGTALDWPSIVSVLATQEPLWKPGTAYGYHALTYGWYVGEVIRRITGTSVGSFLQQSVSGPLGVDAWIGVPPSVEPRVARLLAGDSILNPPASGTRQPSEDDLFWAGRAMTLGAAFPPELVVAGAGFDSPEVHQAEVPGAGGIATAAGLATIWSAMVVPTEGIALVESDVVNDMTQVQSEGEPVWWLPGPYPRWGTGFMLSSERREFLTSSSFGHDGAGGQVAFADPVHKVGFGYVTNTLENQDDPRATSIMRALRRIIEA